MTPEDGIAGQQLPPASVSAHAEIKGKLGPFEASEISLGVIFLVALLGCLYIDSVSTSHPAQTISYICISGLIILLLNRVVRSWFPKKHPAPIRMAISQGAVILDTEVADPVDAVIQIRKALIGRKPLPLADGVVRGADLKDMSNIKQFTTEEQVEDADAIEMLLKRHEQMVLKEISSVASTIGSSHRRTSIEGQTTVAQRTEHSGSESELTSRGRDEETG